MESDGPGGQTKSCQLFLLSSIAHLARKWERCRAESDMMYCSRWRGSCFCPLCQIHHFSLLSLLQSLASAECSANQSHKGNLLVSCLINQIGFIWVVLRHRTILMITFLNDFKFCRGYVQRDTWIREPNCSYQPKMCIHRSSRLTEHMPGLKTQSFLFTLPWRCTQAHAHSHTFLSQCHIAVNKVWHVLEWHLQESSVWPLLPVLSLSQWVRLTQCNGWQWIRDDKFGLSCPILLIRPRGCSEGAVSVSPPWCESLWGGITRWARQLHCSEALVLGSSQSVLGIRSPCWVMEIINPLGPADVWKESWWQRFVLMAFALTTARCWWFFTLGSVYFSFIALLLVDGEVLDVCCVRCRLKKASVMKCARRCWSGFIKSLPFSLQHPCFILKGSSSLE